jgi:OmcA/MtrC family decaheme c-type cytochrome
VDLGGGRYRYVYANALEGVGPDDILRVGTWLDAAVPSRDTSATRDFRASGRPVEDAERRDTVSDDACGNCHGTLVHHGRSGVRLCLTCHTWQSSDPQTADPAAMTAAANPNPLELGRLVHRIHRGKELPTLYQASSSGVDPNPLDTTATLPLPFSPENSTTALVGRSFVVVGDRAERFVFGEIARRATLDGTVVTTVASGTLFPGDLRDCGTCHDRTSTDPEAVTTTTISRRVCSGCHPDVWFGTTGPTDASHLPHTGGPQAHDLDCKGCHVDPTGFPAWAKLWAPISGPSTVHAAIAKSALYDKPVAEITSVTGLVPGGNAVVRFKLRDRTGFIGPTPSAPNPPTADSASPAASPIAKASRALTTLSIRLVGFGADARGPDYPTSISSPTSGPADPRLLTATGGSDPEYVYTFATVVPATAAGGWLVTMEARRFDAAPLDPNASKVPHYTRDSATQKPLAFNWPYTGETVNETADNPMVHVDTKTGIWPPDGPAPRRPIVATEKCLRCHGRFRTFHSGTRNDAGYCVVCHTPDRTDYGRRAKLDGVVNLGATYDGIEERSLHYKVMIHRIHTGRRTGVSSLEGIAPFFMATGFFEGLFPNDLRNCTVCHEGKSYLVDAVPADANGTLANETALTLHTASVHPPEEVPTPPVQAACLGCHATGATFAHVASKTAKGVETCASCHGKGTISVEVAHGLAPPTGSAGSTFSSIVQAVFVPRCATAGCHSIGAWAPELEASVAYDKLVNAPAAGGSGMVQVKPGAPEESYLVTKLRRDMPPGALLDAADLAAIEAWISNGAPND